MWPTKHGWDVTGPMNYLDDFDSLFHGQVEHDVFSHGETPYAGAKFRTDLSHLALTGIDAARIIHHVDEIIGNVGASTSGGDELPDPEKVLSGFRKVDDVGHPAP